MQRALYAVTRSAARPALRMARPAVVQPLRYNLAAVRFNSTKPEGEAKEEPKEEPKEEEPQEDPIVAELKQNWRRRTRTWPT